MLYPSFVDQLAGGALQCSMKIIFFVGKSTIEKFKTKIELLFWHEPVNQ